MRRITGFGRTEGRKKRVCIAAAIALAVFVTGAAAHRKGLLEEAKAARMQKHMAQEVFRFHVLANSDREEDQKLKMAVKEEILRFMKEELPNSESAEMTKAWAETHLRELEETAARRIRREGYRYPVKAEVTTCYFPEKTYGDVTFPQGEYEALRIEIGKAKGQNWWCVLYPNLCFLDAVHAVVPEEGKKELREVLEEEEYEMVTATSKFKVKWFFFQ